MEKLSGKPVTPLYPTSSMPYYIVTAFLNSELIKEGTDLNVAKAARWRSRREKKNGI